MAWGVRRLDGNPIIGRDSADALGSNINGPSLIAAPPWVDSPLGRYYLYFAHHRGSFIRLAVADQLEGPWRIYEPGTLHLDESHFPTTGRRPHIASPDVHLDSGTETVRMYFHGLDAESGRQFTRVATSPDGLSFEAQPEELGRPYFRAFHRDGWWYAIGMPGVVYRSRDGISAFEQGPRLFGPKMRHSALLLDGEDLAVFWTRVGDEPERILCSHVDVRPDWHDWTVGEPEEVLRPELAWEGAGSSVEASARGWVDEPVCQLRDPAIFREDGRTFLLYTVAGESGIAIAELNSPGESEIAPTESISQPRRSATGSLVRQALGRVDPGLRKLRISVVTMSAALLSFASALVVEHFAHLSASTVLLAVVLALSIGRNHTRSGAPPSIASLLVVPAVAVGASELGTTMYQHPNLGDTLFVAGVTASIWVRRFGPRAARLGTLAVLPLIATLIAPVIVVSPNGHVNGADRWWSAAIAVVAMFWVSVTQRLAEHVGLLAAPTAAVATESPAPRPASSRRLLASTRMALQMGGALGLSFVAGRIWFANHWTWVVLTAFIVASGNRGRGDVVHKSVERLLGASVGTLAATAVASAFPAHDDWSIAVIFVVLGVASWLRQINYAFWACGMTAAISLLYGYFGERGDHLLTQRLGAIALGAAIAVLVTWTLFPIRNTDVARRHTAIALRALSAFLDALDGDLADLDELRARFRLAADTAAKATAALRYRGMLPERWRAGHDHAAAAATLASMPGSLEEIAALARSGRLDRTAIAPHITAAHLDTGAALRAVAATAARPTGEALENAPAEPLDTLVARVAVDVNSIAAAPPSTGQGVADLTERERTVEANPRVRLRNSTERVLGYINRTHGTNFELGDRIDDRRPFATFVVTDPALGEAILIWSSDKSAGDCLGYRANGDDRERDNAEAVWLARGSTPSGYPYGVIQREADLEASIE